MGDTISMHNKLEAAHSYYTRKLEIERNITYQRARVKQMFAVATKRLFK